MLPDKHERDPQRDIVFNSIAEASAFIGAVGQTTHTVDLSAGVVEFRMHDGNNQGGYIMGTATIGSSGSGATPTARVLNIDTPIPSAADPALVLAHNFGYQPMVQVWDNDQSPPELVEIEVRFIDLNTVELTAGKTAISSATVMFR